MFVCLFFSDKWALIRAPLRKIILSIKCKVCFTRQVGVGCVRDIARWRPSHLSPPASDVSCTPAYVTNQRRQIRAPPGRRIFRDAAAQRREFDRFVLSFTHRWSVEGQPADRLTIVEGLHKIRVDACMTGVWSETKLSELACFQDVLSASGAVIRGPRSGRAKKTRLHKAGFSKATKTEKCIPLIRLLKPLGVAIAI